MPGSLHDKTKLKEQTQAVKQGVKGIYDTTPSIEDTYTKSEIVICIYAVYNTKRQI